MFLILLPIFLFAQNEASRNQTKYEKFVSNYGSIVKFVEKARKDVASISDTKKSSK